ncbi:RTA1-domain-containing protein [Hypoxylon sp. NC1633]|nr:RTA1-domain-containing protein [Hypoxylon sp. NC1633]
MAPSVNARASFYNYDPSQAVAAVCCALFGVALVWSTFMTFRKRAWIWAIQLLAITLEVLGYAARIASARDVDDLNLYALQFCVIILAPVLMAGIIYVVFGRVVFHVVPAHERTTRLLWVPPRWVTPIFVSFDIIALLVQLIGAVIVSSTKPTDQDAANKLQRGKNIALAGLALQIVAFGLFSIVAARFHFTSKRFESILQSSLEPTGKAGAVIVKGSGRLINSNWRRLLYAINLSCLFILIRSVFRVVEFAQGPQGTVMSQEFYMYVLDTLPIFLVVCSFCLMFPGSYVPYMGFRVPKNPPNSRELASQDSSGVALREV